MAVLDIFSKRQKKLRGDTPDVYIYDQLPQALKVQIVHIWRATLGNETEYRNVDFGVQRVYKAIVEPLCREYGTFILPGTKKQYDRNYLQELVEYLLNQNDAELALDAVEISFRVIDGITRRWEYLHRQNASKYADDAISELNARFLEHGVGFQFENREIIRIDSEIIHNEAVKPALVLLRAAEYAGAQSEFLTAHEHHRHGRAKEALTECLKALESVMKVICTKRNWPYDTNATAKGLLEAVFQNGLVPALLNQHFSALRATLEAGVPTVRNRLGGHGQGTQVTQVPDHLVAYTLHLTASAIVFLAEAEKALP